MKNAQYIQMYDSTGDNYIYIEPHARNSGLVKGSVYEHLIYQN